MSDPTTTVSCAECDHRGNVTDNYCPSCGTEDPWEERPLHDFDDVDLPVIFEVNIHDDNFGLWNAFCEEVFGTRVYGSDVANLPDDLPRMKYYDVSVYWKLTQDLELLGPCSTKRKARKK